jgi:hypothetical protein
MNILYIEDDVDIAKNFSSIAPGIEQGILYRILSQTL